MDRFTSRALIEVEVELWNQQSRLGRFWTRDIDEQAAFIETPALDLTPNTVLHADFLIDWNGAPRYRMEVKLIRSAKDGIVLKFLSDTTGFLYALEKHFIICRYLNELNNNPEAPQVSAVIGHYRPPITIKKRM